MSTQHFLYISTILFILVSASCYTKPEARIAGGQVSGTNQFPYTVELINTLSNGQSVCGGSLINRRYILTAAHCYLENPNISAANVIVGTNDLNANDAQVIRISHAIVHPGYNNETYENDIAIAVLSRDVPESSTTQYMVLSTTAPSANTNLWVAGWGITSDNAQNIPLLQNYAELYAVDGSRCRNAFNIFSEQDSLCLYGVNQQPCSGDSGSAAVLQTLSNGRFVGVGVVSYGRDSCTRRQDSLNVFTSIPAYYNFIALNANLNNVPTGTGFRVLQGALPVNSTNPPQESDSVIGINASTQPPTIDNNNDERSSSTILIPSIALIVFAAVMAL
ncbi:PRSS55 [Acrasis kona]|uniref:PRSS55 n=1 Tax=Acrasis kona TaxID=1008807 RepID=A0AAW2YKG0_9EUKA